MLFCLLVVGSALGQSADPVLRRGGARDGVGIYREGKWGATLIEVENPSDERVDVMAVMGFDHEPEVQFGQRIFLPAKSRRAIQLPIRFDTVSEKIVENRSVTTHTQMFTADAYEKRLGTAEVLLYYEPRQPTVGILDDTTVRHDGRLLFEGFRDIAENVLGKTGLAGVNARNAPQRSLCWDALDALMISAEYPELDTAQLDALRSWLIGGGVLWIQLDRVDPEFCRVLLGDAFQCELVDRTELTTVEMNNSLGRAESTERYEQPIDMVRVLPGETQVRRIVDGWPALLEQNVGDGRVLYSTVGARGWFEESGEPIGAAQSEAISFLRIPKDTRVPDDELTQAVGEQIGYRITSRGTIITILGSFGGVLLVCGIVLGVRKRLEYLAPVGIVASLATVAVLYVLGALKHGELEPTVAVTQVASLSGDRVSMHGAMGVYTPSAYSDEITSASGTVFWPSMQDMSGKLIRMIWTDLNAYRWEHLTLPEGAVRPFTMQGALTIDEEVTALGRFGPEGLEITLDEGSLTNVTDVVLPTARGHFAPSDQGDGRYVARTEDLLSPGRFFRSVAGTDARRRHEQIYTLYFESGGVDLLDKLDDQQRLMFWVDRIDTGLGLGFEAEQLGDAMVIMPLRMQPTEPGTKVRVPASFVPFEPSRSPWAGMVSTPYDTRKREWIGQISAPKEVAIEFSLPREVLPLDVESLALTLSFGSSSGWAVHLRDPNSNKPQTIEQWANPGSSLRIELTEYGYSIDKQGRVLVAFGVNSVPGVAVDPWTLQSVTLSASGTVLQRDGGIEPKNEKK